MEKTKEYLSAPADVEQIHPPNASAGDQIWPPCASTGDQNLPESAGYNILPPSATAKLIPPPFGPELPFYAAKDSIVLVPSKPGMVIRDVTCACGMTVRGQVWYGASFVFRCYVCKGAYVADIPATPPVTTE